jgi:hypothetical protein
MLLRFPFPCLVLGLSLFTVPVVLSGCGDDGGGPMPMPDAGRPTDGEAPTVVGTTPEDGASNVSVTPTIVIRFSEAMNIDRGTTNINGTEVQATGGSWNIDRDELTFAISRAFPPDTEIAVTVETDFTDVAGNALAEPFAFSFTTLDEVPPFVATADPEEGAATVDRDLGAVTLTFNEAMTTSGFTVDISGGAATAGTPSFDDDAQVLTVPVDGLDYDTAYRLSFDGFTDLAGNAWDPTPELGDGALDFRTGPDRDPPQVVSSMPMEGQVDVDPDTLESITVTFDEPMDPLVTFTTIRSGGEVINGVVQWDAASDNTVATVFPQDVLPYETTASVLLTGFQDALGNNVADDAAGGNGAIDFTTGPDMFQPGVASSMPSEGETGVALDLSQIIVTFTEAMDTSVTGFVITADEGDDPGPVTGVWEPGGVILRLPVPATFGFATTYSVDLTGLRDAAGNPLPATDPTTSDGVLDFTSRGPNGENCAEALRVVDGTTVDGVTSFSIAADALVDQDGGTQSCDPTGAGPDAVFVYEKTTASLSDGGALLRVAATSKAAGENINVEVVAGGCTPAEERFAPEQLACLWARDAWETFLDVGPGTYHVFVADGDEGEFDGVDVELEELTAAPEGELCAAPYTTESSIHSTPRDGVDRWEIPADEIVSFDMDTSWGGPGSISCDDQDTYGDIHGVDAVIEVEKASADSLLRVTVDGPPASDLNVEILTSACDPTATPRVSRFCNAGVASHLFDGLVGYQGTLYVWVAAEATSDDWPAVDVEVEELAPVAVGEACGRGTALSAGSNTVTLGSGERYGVPACLAGSSGNLTWFEVELTQNAAVVDPAGTGAYALVDPVSGAELGCGDAGDATAQGVVGNVGETVCVAIPNGTGITSVTVTDVDYAGVGGPPEDLEISRPLEDDGDEDSLVSDRWLAVSNDTLWLAYGGSDLMEAPLSGGRATIRGPTDGINSSNLGYDGLFVDGDLFSVDDASTMTAHRLYRLWDGAADPWTPGTWDTMPSYVNDDIRAGTFDGDDFVLVTRGDGTIAPTFFTVAAEGGAPTDLGANANLENVVALAADDTYVFVIGEADDDDGVFRVARSAITGTPERLIPPGVTVTTSFLAGSGLAIDATTDATYLYFKASSPEGVHVVKDPGGADPTYLGRILVTDDQDYGLAYDRSTGQLYVFDTRENGSDEPRFLRLE